MMRRYRRLQVGRYAYNVPRSKEQRDDGYREDIWVWYRIQPLRVRRRRERREGYEGSLRPPRHYSPVSHLHQRRVIHYRDLQILSRELGEGSGLEGLRAARTGEKFHHLGRSGLTVDWRVI
jgi:hypothetical protein